MQWEWDWPARHSSGSRELLETGLVSSFKNLTEGTEYTVEYDEGSLKQGLSDVG